MGPTKNKRYWEKVEKAAKKFGRTKIRPFDREEFHGFQVLRRGLNYHYTWNLHSRNLKEHIKHIERKEAREWKFQKKCLKKNDSVLSWSQVIWIDSKDRFKKMMMELEHEKILAFDTERSIDHEYMGPYTCIFQLSTGKKNYIIDTIALAYDIDELEKIFSNPDALKICFAGTQDLLCLQKDFSLTVCGIIDIKIVYCLLFGEQTIGFGKAVRKLLDISINKEAQCADWTLRPLPSQTIYYAATDTRMILHSWEAAKRIIKTSGSQYDRIINQMTKENGKLHMLFYERRISKYERTVMLVVNDKLLQHSLTRLLNYVSLIAMEVDLPREKILPSKKFVEIVRNKRLTTKDIDLLTPYCHSKMIHKIAYSLKLSRDHPKADCIPCV